MSKKYELVLDDTISFWGWKLFRIRALISFGSVEAGELGGYIQKEDNLSHEDNAWVWGDAKVWGNAEVWALGDIIVFKNHWSSGRHFTYTKSNKMWSVGCFYGTADELIKKAYKDSQKSGDYYKAYVEFVERLEELGNNMAELTFPDLQRQMQLGKQSKQGVNFTFRNAEQIYNKFKELDSGWILTVTDELFAISDRLFVKATATARKGDETHQATAYAELDKVPVFKTGNKQMQDPQWTGAVSSYARKYALQGLFAIGEKDVDDYPVEDSQQQTPHQQSQQTQVVQQSQVPLINQEQYNQIIHVLNQLAEVKQTVFDPVANFYLQKCGVVDFHALTVDKFDWLINSINSQINKAQAKQNHKE